MAGTVDLTETRQPSLYASSTIPFAFAFICVSLRFWCRWKQAAGFWLDDWLILVSLAWAIGLTADLLWWIPHGLGRHVETFGPNVVENFSIGLFVAELTYTGVIIFVKFSIGALYWRIFKNASIKRPIIILMVLVIMWGIAVFLLTLVQCVPTRGFWDKTIEASCDVDSNKFLFAISIPNILIDVALLVLPVPYVAKLQVSKDRKVVIMSMFLLGGGVCVASIMRFVSVATQSPTGDVTWNFTNLGIWAKIEADFAIISACLPTLRPLYLIIRSKFLGEDATQIMPSYPDTSKPSKAHTFDSWGVTTLRTMNDESMPFSVYANGPDSSNSHSPNLREKRQSDMGWNQTGHDEQRLMEPVGITVETRWDVEHGLARPGHAVLPRSV